MRYRDPLCRQVLILGLLILLLAGCSDDAERPLGPDTAKLATATALADDPGLVPAAGPFVFARDLPAGHGSMRPLRTTAKFSLDPAAWTGGFVLRLATGQDDAPALSSAVVVLNGREILGPDAFDGEPQVIDVPVDLAEANRLEVKVAGKPGSACEIVILGTRLGEPQAQVLYPGLDNQGAKLVPTTFTVGYRGQVGDDPAALPTAVRYVYLPAAWDGVALESRADYEAHAAEIFAQDDLPWSAWMPYPAEAELRQVTFADQDPDAYFLFAVQVRDTTGRVSDDFAYQQDVMHLRISAEAFRPEVTIDGGVLGIWSVGLREFEVPAGEEFAFVWTADASAYNGQIVSSRWGWDLADPADPLDPGWAVAPGLAEANFATVPMAFTDGVHELVVRVEDDAAQVRLMRVRLHVLVGEPQARVLYPGLSPIGFRLTPTTLRVGYEGGLGDTYEPMPGMSVRVLLIPAEHEGTIIQTRAQYEQYAPAIFARDDLPWSPWGPYFPDEASRMTRFEDLEVNAFYLFAVQVRDVFGRVSDDFAYQRDVMHLRAVENVFRPSLIVFEADLGSWQNQPAPVEIAPGQVLRFSWTATAEEYNGGIVAYRHGWDLIDPDDPDDPGWQVDPGLAPENLAAAPRSYQEGLHTLMVQAVDDAGVTTRLRIPLIVVIPPPPAPVR